MPSVTGVSITSGGEGVTTYGPYNNVDVAVAFSRAVTVTGAPRLALTIGTRTRQAAFRSVSGSTVNFRYVVMEGDQDTDGISIAANALTLNGGSIKAGSVDAALDLGSHALGAQGNHKVYGRGATFEGEPSPAYVFTRGVRKSVTLPATLPRPSAGYALAATPALPGGLVFTGGTRTLSGAPAAAMAKTTYTLEARTLRPDWDDLSAPWVQTLADTLPFTIEVVSAQVSGVSIASGPAGGSYAAGENVDVDVTFDNPVK